MLEPVPLVVSKEVLWHLYEINFRCELLSLDEIASEVGTDPEKVSDRQLVVLDWIPHFESTVVPAWDSPHTGSRGFASESQQERAEASMGLLAIMGGWSKAQTQLGTELLGIVAGLHRCGGNVVRAVRDMDTYAQAHLERLVVMHYLECYAYVFERAPSMPHRLDSSTQ